MTKPEVKMLLDLVLDNAAKLRAAGVLEITIQGLGVKLAAEDPAVAPDSSPKKPDDEDDPPDTNPWNDPATFGRSKGVPGKDPRKEPGQ